MPITIKSDKFIVESYTASASQSTDAPRRFITLTSPDLSHGIRVKVTILFFKTNFSPQGVGHVGNVGGFNFDPIVITAWGEPSLFDSMYAMLVAEKPLTFAYDYSVDSADPTGAKKDIPLTTYSLSTGTELPGDYEKDVFIKFPLLQNATTPGGSQ